MRSVIRHDADCLLGGSELLLALVGEVVVVVRPERRTGRMRGSS
jgi:hypothetical protein